MQAEECELTISFEQAGDIEWGDESTSDSGNESSQRPTIEFERAFGDAERTAESTLKSAQELMKHVRALKKAAQIGNIAQVRRAQERIQEASNSLRQEAANASTSWPFSDDDERTYITDRYADELRAAAEGVGLNIYERDGNLISYPSVVRIMPSDRAVRVDRKKVSNIRPSHLAGLLLANQKKTSGFSSARFIESLYNVYSDIVSVDSTDRMALGGGRVVPLARVYKLMTALPGASREYNRSDFARDIYLIDANGPRVTRKGAEVSFPSSTGTRRRSSDLFSFVGTDGQYVDYYGLRFTEAD